MSADAVIVGAGIGGLSAAIALAGAGWRVEVWEAAPEPGGKAGRVVMDGVEADTGPSVLTVPAVFDQVFQAGGAAFREHVALVTPDPAFRYLWPDGTALDVRATLGETRASVAASLGSDAAVDFDAFLAYAGRIWEAAAPRFVEGPAPTWTDLLSPSALLSVLAIDPFQTMRGAIVNRVRSPHLRDVLLRYATYNGSDPRRAPATLNCIAHVELAGGGYGVHGGIGALVRAMVALAEARGVRIRCGQPVRSIRVEGGRVVGVEGDNEGVDAPVVVANADVAHVAADLLPSAPIRPPKERSTSGWTAIWRATRRERAAHTVLFPTVYEQEFVDLFDRASVPSDPTVYACAQAVAHALPLPPSSGEPLFTMVNAPAGWEGDPGPIAAVVGDKLRAAGLLGFSDTIVWQRTPADLESRFPRTGGALYGAASNDAFAAFRRPANRVSGVRGLYLASGSAHPGGGLPLCARSGLTAAAAARADFPR